MSAATRSQQMKNMSRTVALAIALGCLLVPVGRASADNTQDLGLVVFRDILVDAPHDRVFVSGGSLAVADLGGNLLGTVAGISAARQIALSPDGSKLVVANADFLKIVDPVTMTVTDTIATGVGSCPDAVAPSSGKIFYTYGDCGGGTPGLAAVDLTTKVITTGLTSGVSPYGAHLVSVPGAPSLLAAHFGGPNPYDDSTLVLLDTTGGTTPTSTVRVTKTFADTTGLHDVALTPDGTSVVVAASGTQSTSVYSTADLSLLGSYPGRNPTAVAIRDNGTVATGINSGDKADIRIFSAGATSPLREVDLGTVSGTSIVVQPRGLAFGPVRVYAVGDDGKLHTLTAGPVASLKIATDKATYAYGAAATVTLTLASPTTDRTVKLYGVTADGARTLLATGAAGVGTGKFVAHPKLTQNLTLEAVFAGDDGYAPARASTKVKVGAKLVISAPSSSMSGAFHKVRRTPAPTISVNVLPVQSTSTCVKFVVHEWRAGSWHGFGSIKCPKRSKTTGKFGIRMIGFPAGDRIRISVSYPTTKRNVSTTSAWYYVLFV